MISCMKQITNVTLQKFAHSHETRGKCETKQKPNNLHCKCDWMALGYFLILLLYTLVFLLSLANWNSRIKIIFHTLYLFFVHLVHKLPMPLSICIVASMFLNVMHLIHWNSNGNQNVVWIPMSVFHFHAKSERDCVACLLSIFCSFISIEVICSIHL